ncbi:uncharacterized protein LOC117191807 isoform X1 [Drosophila miranda]|uniref:uncharacterized protein LOC117191807 isoform X1 n=1 Tax=Drosophila miranda TaxID=7229 RepID=UPI00143F5269|nr:uncharacterized protein LOC117191807 isoform X1 [Drosophila miranda]
MIKPKDDSHIDWSQLALDLLLYDAVDRNITVSPELAKELLNMCFGLSCCVAGDAMDAVHGALAVAKACNRKYILKADLRMFNYICSRDSDSSGSPSTRGL